MAGPSLEATLKRLANGFTVRDIMVPAENLTCAFREKDAPTVSDEHRDFNVIPIRRERKQITAYYERDTRRIKVLQTSDLVSEGTSILDVAKSLAKRPFHFVLAHDRIAGYVHFSDLNNPLVKLTLYAVLEALESHALGSLNCPIDEDYLRDKLSGRRFKSVKRKFDRAKSREANRTIADFLNIEDILRIASKAGKVRLNEQMIKSVTRVRNKVAHQVNPVVQKHEDVIQVAKVVEECTRLLKEARGA